MQPQSPSPKIYADEECSDCSCDILKCWNGCLSSSLTSLTSSSSNIGGLLDPRRLQHICPSKRLYWAVKSEIYLLLLLIMVELWIPVRIGYIQYALRQVINRPEDLTHIPSSASSHFTAKEGVTSVPYTALKMKPAMESPILKSDFHEKSSAKTSFKNTRRSEIV